MPNQDMFSGNPAIPPSAVLKEPMDELSPARYSIRDILRKGFPTYLENFPVPFYKEKAVRAIMACGTGELGYTLSKCAECGTLQMHADSCGNRNCPSCGFPRQVKWIEERNADLLEGVPYVHVVFTVPHELNSLIYQNQKVLINNLFYSAKNAVLDLCHEKYKLIPGLLMVLHTFSSNLSLHYHIHMLASAAGLSPDKKTFSVFGPSGYFLPVPVLSKRFRSYFLEGVKGLKDSDEIIFAGDASNLQNSYEWSEFMDVCYGKDWNIEIKKYEAHGPDRQNPGKGPTAMDFAGYAIHPSVSPQQVHLEVDSQEPVLDGNIPERPDASIVNGYFSEYAFRTAVTDNRIKAWDTEKVSLEYKKYHDGKCTRAVMNLDMDEFIRRFLLHILEPGIQRIRYAGFLASCVRKKNLAIIREILDLEVPHDSEMQNMTLAEIVKHLTGRDPMECPVCHSKMYIQGHRVKIPEFASHSINHCFIPDS